jgi:hypothetical protein
MAEGHLESPSLHLIQQHLAVFVERHHGDALRAVQIHLLQGGLQATGVFRVQAQLQGLHVSAAVYPIRGESGVRRDTPGACPVPCIAGHGSRKARPVTLETVHADTISLLFPEWVRHADASWRAGESYLVFPPLSPWRATLMSLPSSTHQHGDVDNPGNFWKRLSLLLYRPCRMRSRRQSNLVGERLQP